MNRRALAKELEGKHDELKSLLNVKEDECGNIRFRLNALESAIWELDDSKASQSTADDIGLDTESPDK